MGFIFGRSLSFSSKLTYQRLCMSVNIPVFFHVIAASNFAREREKKRYICELKETFQYTVMLQITLVRMSILLQRFS